MKDKLIVKGDVTVPRGKQLIRHGAEISLVIFIGISE